MNGVSTAHTRAPTRSEEHTSELQSRLHLVCRLLLEKKNLQLRSKCPAPAVRPPGGAGGESCTDAVHHRPYYRGSRSGLLTDRSLTCNKQSLSPALI